MEHLNINQFNYWAKNHIIDDNKFDKDGFIIMENDFDYKSTGIIASIFEDHWDNYYNKYYKVINIKRPNADKEIRKVIDCANHNLGSSVYVCPNDNEVIFSHHACKCNIRMNPITVEADY